MQKRIIFGLIVALLVLAVQDRFASSNLNIPISHIGLPYIAPAQTPTTGLLKPGFNRVIRVIDGDTIVVVANGVSEKIRLIGVDTPETVDPRKQVECFGKEASELTKTLLLDTPVILEADSTQGDRDKYGRLLRYVFLGDGTLINEKIISLGYGHEYTYRTPYKYQAEFKDAELSAREAQKGLWAPDACRNS